MEVPEGNAQQWLIALGGFVATALAWFVFYVKRIAGTPTIDPATKVFLDGLKEDLERVENALKLTNARHEDVSNRLAALEGEVKVIRSLVDNGRRGSGWVREPDPAPFKHDAPSTIVRYPEKKGKS